MNPKIKIMINYAAGLILVSAACLLRVAIERLLGPGLPTFITFYPAIMIIALFLGPGPGLLASVYTLFVVDYFIITPYSLKNWSQIQSISLIMFFLMCILINLVAHRYRRNRDRLEQIVTENTEELSLANDELNRQIEACRLSENTLLEERNILETTLASIQDAILIYDGEMNVRKVNNCFSDYYGFNPVGLNVTEIIARTRCRHLDNSPFVLDNQPTPRALRGEKVHNQSFLITLANGEDAILETSSTPLLVGDCITGVVTVWHDVTAHYKNVDNIQRAKEEWERTFDSVPDLIALLDNRHRIVRVNRAMAERMNREPADCIGLPCYLDIHGDSASHADCPHARSMSDGSMHEVELHDDILDRDFLITTAPLFDSEKNIYATVHIARDITKLKQSEQALQVKEEQLQLFIKHAPVALAMFDRNMRYLHISRRWLNDYGLGERELRGLSHYDVFPEISESWKEAHRRGLAGEVLRNEADRFERADGSFQWIRWEIRPWYENQDDIGGVVIFSEDVSERIKFEEALLESEERLRFHMENSPMAVIEMDKDFIVTRWTEESERTFGWSAAETIGKPFANLNMIFYDDMPAVERTIAQLTDGKSQHVVATNRNYTKSGDIRYCTWYNSVLMDQDGKMSSVLSKAVDITDLRRVEQERQKFISLADHSTEFIGMCDMNMVPFYVNEAGMRLVGLESREEALGINVLDCFFEEDRDYMANTFFSAVLQDGAGETEIRFRHFKSGEPIWMMHSVFIIRDAEAQPVGVATVSRNIHPYKQAQEALFRAHSELELRVVERTEELAESVRHLGEEIAVRERTERGLQHLNQLYAVMSEANKAIVRSSDRDRSAMFRDFCRIAVEQGGFLLAWIGELNEKTGEILTAAAYGATSYLDDIRITVNEEPYGEGPTSTAIRTGTYNTCNDFQNSPCTAPWHEKGRAHGFNSSASIALKEEGRVIGALALYAGEKDFFDQQHVELLMQIGNDVSFALDNIIREVRRFEAEHQLQEQTLQRLQATEALRKQELLLMQQSRQAAMGEMIGNIAHQWRQPLNTLGLFTQRIGIFYGSPCFDKEFLNNSVAKSMEIIQYMSKTIDDFRSFFSTDREKTDFRVDTAVSKALSLVEASFKDRRIQVELDEAEDIVIYGFPNEYAQVLLNILVNAKDALFERNIEFPKVKISSFSENGLSVVSIADNAGGIPEEILSKVFDPYFTTKGPQQGTGVGLFMSRSIIENNMGGRISVRNTEEGAEFRVEV